MASIDVGEMASIRFSTMHVKLLTMVGCIATMHIVKRGDTPRRRF